MVAKHRGHGDPGSAASHKIARLGHPGLKGQELEGGTLFSSRLCSHLLSDLGQNINPISVFLSL